MDQDLIREILWKWGKEVVIKMITRIRETDNYSGHKRGITRLENYFNPELKVDAEKVMWELSLPAYAQQVDEGQGPNYPNKGDILSWANDRKLPEEGISKQAFVFETRRLVALRGVVGSNFFELFDQMSGGLSEQLYNIGEQLIEKRISEIKNKIETQ